MRTGLVATKLGMTRVIGKDRNLGATVLQLEQPIVVAQKTTAKDGYNAVIIGAGKVKAKNVSKPRKGMFAKAGVKPSANWLNSALRRKIWCRSVRKSSPRISSKASSLTLPGFPSAAVLPGL